MIRLYEYPPTRSQRARWALEELGLGFENKLVRLMRGEQRSPEYLCIHPLAAVPALKTPGYTMFESSAIVMQLLDEHPETGLAPNPGSPERALYYQWCVFAASELDPALMMYFDNTLRSEEHARVPGDRREPKFAERGKRDFFIRAKALSEALKDRAYLVDDKFTGADIMIGHSCFMAQFMKLMGDFPVLQDYHHRLQQRPAYQRAYSVPFHPD